MSYLTWSNWFTGSLVFIIMMLILTIITTNAITLFMFNLSATNGILCYLHGVITLDISDDDQSVQ